MRRLINHQETNLQNHYRSSTRAIQQDGTPNPARFFSEPWNHVDDRFYEAVRIIAPNALLHFLLVRSRTHPRIDNRWSCVFVNANLMHAL